MTHTCRGLWAETCAYTHLPVGSEKIQSHQIKPNHIRNKQQYQEMDFTNLGDGDMELTKLP